MSNNQDNGDPGIEQQPRFNLTLSLSLDVSCHANRPWTLALWREATDSAMMSCCELCTAEWEDVAAPRDRLARTHGQDRLL